MVAFDVWGHDEEARNVIAAIDAYDRLSDYDKAVEALAPYLPDGWVAQTRTGGFIWTNEKPEIEKDYWMMGSPTRHSFEPFGLMQIPRCPDWRASLRRIQSGRVLPHDGEGGE